MTRIFSVSRVHGLAFTLAVLSTLLDTSLLRCSKYYVTSTRSDQYSSKLTIFLLSLHQSGALSSLSTPSLILRKYETTKLITKKEDSTLPPKTLTTALYQPSQQPHRIFPCPSPFILQTPKAPSQPPPLPSHYSMYKISIYCYTWTNPV